MVAKKKPSQRWHWLVAFVFLAPLAMCGGTGGYATLKIRWARRTVHTFCSGVFVGSPVGDLDARAARLGLRTMHVPGHPPEPDRFVAWEGWVFARSFCNVTHDGAVVLSKQTSTLD